MLKVWFTAAEAAPFAKTGGLGDVAGSLPQALKKLGIDARICLPAYQSIPKELLAHKKKVVRKEVPLAWRKQRLTVWETDLNGVPAYLLDQPYYFDRPAYYGYFDDAERFAFFSRAALDILPDIGFQPDIIHAHDWHTALTPLYLRGMYAQQDFWRAMSTVLTIHNLAYQGRFSPEVAEDVFGLAWDYHSGSLEYYESVNCLKGGILAADYVTTVSPSYAKEICTSEGGDGLDGELRSRGERLLGIVNGIDTDNYNPWRDEALTHRFHRGLLPRRKENKHALQAELGLEISEAPLVVMVSRLVAAKGLDLICDVMEDFFAQGCQFALLGSGEAHYEAFFRYAQKRWPGWFAARIGFDDALARRLYGGGDLLLMPSLYEPCGISQLIAMRYGCLPLVRETGGLRDTVRSYNRYSGEGTGFSFSEPYRDSFNGALAEAIALYQDKDAWDAVVKQAMGADFGWAASAKLYRDLYQTARREKNGAGNEGEH